MSEKTCPVCGFNGMPGGCEVCGTEKDNRQSQLQEILKGKEESLEACMARITGELELAANGPIKNKLQTNESIKNDSFKAGTQRTSFTSQRNGSEGRGTE
jgi:hypothetical protein